jgi:hypothetical protein
MSARQDHCNPDLAIGASARDQGFQTRRSRCQVSTSERGGQWRFRSGIPSGSRCPAKRYSSATINKSPQYHAIPTNSTYPNQLDLLVIGFDNKVWTTFWNPNGRVNLCREVRRDNATGTTDVPQFRPTAAVFGVAFRRVPPLGAARNYLL